MPDTAPQALTATVTCRECGVVDCDSPEEADRRAEKHTRVTGHATVTEARREETGEAP